MAFASANSVVVRGAKGKEEDKRYRRDGSEVLASEEGGGASLSLARWREIFSSTLLYFSLISLNYILKEFFQTFPKVRHT